MSSKPKALHIGQKLSEARHLLKENNIEHIPVVKGEKLVGMISSADIMRLTFDAGNEDSRSIDAILDHQFTVEAIMTKNLSTILKSDTIKHAAELLVNGAYHSLPVIEEGGQLVGIVTSTDLIRYLLEQY